MGLIIENPVLTKEVRGRLRARRQSKGGRIGSVTAVTTIVLLVYYFSLRSMLDGSNSTADGVFVFFSLGLELTLLLFLVPALASSIFTQEREQQTWNALLLSRLTHAEIVVGKFVAALIPALIVLAVFAPLKLFAALIGEVGLLRYLMSNVLLLCTVFFLTGLSLFWSWVMRRTYIATAATFGTVAFLVIGTYLIYGLYMTAVNYSSYIKPEEFIVLWLNPYSVMWFVVDRSYPYASTDPNYESTRIAMGLTYCTMSIVVTLLLLWLMSRNLARGPKELEQ